MLKITIIGFAIVIAAVGVGIEADQDVKEPDDAEAFDATIVAEEAATAEEETHADTSRKLRLCLGPARITFGGHPVTRVAFGGEGCNRDSASILGVRLLPSNAVAAGSTKHSSLLL